MVNLTKAMNTAFRADIVTWRDVAEQVGTTAGAWVLAAFLHELVHAVVAKLLGGKIVAVDPIGLSVTVGWEQGVARWRPRLVGLAPFLLGCLSAALMAYMGMLPTGLTEWGALALFTVGGSLEDYSMLLASGAVERPQPLDHLHPVRRDLWLAMGMMYLGAAVFWIASLVHVPNPIWYGSVGVIIGGGTWFGATVSLRGQSLEPGASPGPEHAPNSEGRK